MSELTRVLITGADGFIGRNLALYLSERTNIEVLKFTRSNELKILNHLLRSVDFVFHLAGVNRSKEEYEFTDVNASLTKKIANEIALIYEQTGKMIPVIYASSTQAALNNSYGLSKLAGEKALFELNKIHKIPVHIFRLPNVFGKWSRPNYNSVVSTFCYNIARDIPIKIIDPDASIKMVYIDDVVQEFINIIDRKSLSSSNREYADVSPKYEITVGALAKKIFSFKDSRNSLIIDRVGNGFTRALYSTYISYLPLEKFSYSVPKHSDSRGIFVEMLKTLDSGQFSFFTAIPGAVRGGHYHHSKTEKFLVVKGQALFRFRNMQTGETHELETNGENLQIVETIPGWTHDITNQGNEEMIVMLWANEIFNRSLPDTINCPL